MPLDWQKTEGALELATSIGLVRIRREKDQPRAWTVTIDDEAIGQRESVYAAKRLAVEEVGRRLTALAVRRMRGQAQTIH